MSIVLVTGGSGFVGSYCIVHLLKAGHTVRTSVRTLDKQNAVLQTVKKAGATADNRLTFWQADLLNDKGWKDAVTGCDFVLHVASPFPRSVPRDENELIIPAREGTLRVLKVARDAGVKRVVLTSSSVAVTYGHPPQRQQFDESSWTNINAPGVTAYPKSKTLAEQAAWEFLKREGGSLELAVVNPVGIFGPVISRELSASVWIVKLMLEGKMSALPRISFGAVDVRDVADLHILAMEHEAAKNQRFLATADGYISLVEIALLLKSKLGEKAKGVGTKTIPDWILRAAALFNRDVRGVIAELGNIKDASNAKAKRLLNWSPRSKEESILATAESLISTGNVSV
jgi:nucleoside-diphosphate-sugar epimerase